MALRVEELASRAGVSVDTVRYYQSKSLLDPPRREGRIAWYDDAHLVRLERIRSLQQRGFTLATIARLVSGDLDAADEALIAQLSGADPTWESRSLTSTSFVDNAATDEPDGTSATEVSPDQARTSGRPEDLPTTYDLAQLAEATGVPEALLAALENDGLLVPRRIGGVARYTDEDVDAARAGLRLLEWGIPLADLVDLARRHQAATEVIARDAVALFARHVREPLRMGARPDALRRRGDHDQSDLAVSGLLQAYAELLPAADALVGHHFVRTLVQAAFDHVEQRGSEEEQRAVRAQLAQGGHGLDPVSSTPDRRDQSEVARSTKTLQTTEEFR